MVSTNHNLFWRERRAEAVLNQGQGPSAYQPNTLPLGQTGSQMHMIMSGVKLVMWPETVLGSALPLTSFDVAHPGMAKLLRSVYFYNWLHPNIIVFDFTKVEYHG